MMTHAGITTFKTRYEVVLPKFKEKEVLRERKLDLDKNGGERKNKIEVEREISRRVKKYNWSSNFWPCEVSIKTLQYSSLNKNEK